MVKRKDEENLFDSWRRMAEEYDRKNPIIDERFYVVEVTSAYNTGGYYGEDVPEKPTRVSPYYDTLDEADGWMNLHEPDKGKTLRTQKDIKRRIVFERWSTV